MTPRELEALEVIEDITEAFSTEDPEELNQRYLGWLRDLFVLTFMNDDKAMTLLKRYRKFILTKRAAPMTREALEERILQIVRKKIEPSFVRYRGHAVVWFVKKEGDSSPLADPHVDFRIFSYQEFPTRESVERYKKGGMEIERLP